MSLGEYSTLMREAGFTTAPGGGGGGDGAGSGVMQVEIKHTHILRLDEKWEKFYANAVVETIRISKEMMEPIKILIYSMAVSMIVVVTTKLIRTLRDNSKNNNNSNNNNNDDEKQ